MPKNWKISRRWSLVLKACGITALAFLLSDILIAPFSVSTSSVFSSPEKTDFVLSDFYAQVANRRPVRNLSNKIVVVDIDRAGREEIADIIETVAMCGPSAIALDVIFEDVREDDSRLLDVLKNSGNVVLPLGLGTVEGNSRLFEITDRPFFYDSLPGVRYGAVNLPGIYARSTIREFPVAFPVKDGKEILSFVAEVAREVSAEDYSVLRARGNDLETIDYASREIPVMDFAGVYENPERLAGKVVMIGAVNEASDMHSTPVNGSMAGLMIHAHALSTVLEGKYYTNVPKYVDYGLASLLCFLIVLYTISITAKVKGLIFRILQVVLVYLIVRVGYELYVEYKIVSNFSMALLMVAFGLFAVDIWNGIIGLGELSSKWWRKFRSKKSGDVSAYSSDSGSDSDFGGGEGDGSADSDSSTDFSGDSSGEFQ